MQINLIKHTSHRIIKHHHWPDSEIVQILCRWTESVFTSSLFVPRFINGGRLIALWRKIIVLTLKIMQINCFNISACDDEVDKHLASSSNRHKHRQHLLQCFFCNYRNGSPRQAGSVNPLDMDTRLTRPQWKWAITDYLTRHVKHRLPPASSSSPSSSSPIAWLSVLRADDPQRSTSKWQQPKKRRPRWTG